MLLWGLALLFRNRFEECDLTSKLLNEHVLSLKLSLELWNEVSTPIALFGRYSAKVRTTHSASKRL